MSWILQWKLFQQVSITSDETQPESLVDSSKQAIRSEGMQKKEYIISEFHK